MTVSKSHPRHESLKIRDKLVSGVAKGVASVHGLIAHGRGEAFDYLLKEKTQSFAKKAIRAGAAMLLLAKNPVISVNGNAAALCAKELVELSKIIPAKIEVNIFHDSRKREKKIQKYLLKSGANEILMPKLALIKYIESNRRYCNPNGIYLADVVFVPLEDGDRCDALRKMGKKIITIDLNPLSRTAKKANVTIVDNVVRAMPLLVKELKSLKKNQLKDVIKTYNNTKMLKEAVKLISK